MSVKIVEIEWIESEAGWGQRPDGFTYHPTIESAQQYINDYWTKMPTEVPGCYSRPENITPIFVNEVFALLVEYNGTVYSDKKVRHEQA